jgi:DNA-binding NtrC family response regulator
VVLLNSKSPIYLAPHKNVNPNGAMSKEKSIKAKVLVVDDEQGARDALKVILEDDYEVTTAASGHEAIAYCQGSNYGLVFLDVAMPEIDGIETLKRLRTLDEPMDVVMISASDKAEQAVQSIKLGAYDYITKPFEPDDILSAVARVLEKQTLQREVRYLRSEIAHRYGELEIVSKDPRMLDILRLVNKVANTSSSVLITGESGTGKELIARSLHQQGNRRGLDPRRTCTVCRRVRHPRTPGFRLVEKNGHIRSPPQAVS